MDIVLHVFNAEHGPIKGFKPMLVASMKSKRVSEDSLQVHVKQAVTEATKFASTHIKRS